VAATLAPPTHYTWTFPGVPILVRIRLDVVGILQEYLQPMGGCAMGGNVEQRGLLLGRMGGSHGSEITAALGLLDDEPGAMAAELESRKTSTDLAPIGFYRTQTDENLRLTDADYEIARRHFSDPGNVFLVVHLSSSGPDKAAFFFWDQGEIQREFSFLEFPFDASVLTARESRRLRNREEGQPAAASEPASPESREEPLQAPRVLVRSPWKPVVIVVAAMAVLVAGARYLLPDAPPASANPAAAVAAATTLSLKLVRQGGDLLVSWDPGAALKGGPATGTLLIRDGAKDRTLPLSADQVRSAVILIAPQSDEVHVQLVLLLPDGSRLTAAGVAVLPRPAARRNAEK